MFGFVKATYKAMVFLFFWTRCNSNLSTENYYYYYYYYYYEKYLTAGRRRNSRPAGCLSLRHHWGSPSGMTSLLG